MSKPSSKANKYSGRKRFHKKGPFASAQPAQCLPAEQPSLFGDPGNHPRIISRPEHCVSRKDIDREALKVLYGLKDNGYIAYLVGGSVRDLLLGRRPKDFDIGTNARPEDLKKLFRHSRIIGRRFRLVHVYFRGGKIIEVSTFRCRSDHDDREAMGEGIGDTHIFGSPQEDAFRRDLTINGLFYNIADFSNPGLFIETRRTLNVGEEIMLSFNMQGYDRPFKIKGNISRSNQQGFGVEFCPNRQMMTQKI